MDNVTNTQPHNPNPNAIQIQHPNRANPAPRSKPRIPNPPRILKSTLIPDTNSQTKTPLRSPLCVYRQSPPERQWARALENPQDVYESRAQ
jgi:hypothetical protein